MPRFPREGAVDPLAGIKLLGEIRKSDPYMPLILQSAEESNRAYASRLEASFIDKNSKKMNIDLRDAVRGISVSAILFSSIRVRWRK